MIESAPPGRRKWCIAHRGASAYAPEHTVEAYRLAIEQGADFIEPDLQVTSDGVLVCLHDVTLERTTDVAERFPGRGRDERVDGESVRRWYVQDFALDEIRSLDAGSWFGDGFFDARVPTFVEALRLARGRVGVFPETKDPGRSTAHGSAVEELLLSDVAQEGFFGPEGAAQLVVQSFSANSLRRIGERAPEIARILLIEHAGEIKGRAGATAPLADLPRIRELARGIGPSKDLILADPTLVDRAHEAGLVVVPWTFRSDRPGRFANVKEEMSYFLHDLDVDGLFTNNPDLFPR
jgi:glycerophosphoryl diester phosphodiesterase